jgi:hypothetical protein
LDEGVTDWASLRHTYGPADRVPLLLSEAEGSGRDDGEVWEELWTLLYHQGTVYSASYAALPALARMSRLHAPNGDVAALHLAAMIVAATDGPDGSATVRRRYKSEIADLKAMAIRNLPYSKDDTEFIYGLQALMAFEDGGVWQRTLPWLANGELELDCPTCAEHLLVSLEGPAITVESFGDSSLAATTVTPVEPPSATVEGRLLALARDHERPGVAVKLPYLFGTATCPRCHMSFEVPSALV